MECDVWLVPKRFRASTLWRCRRSTWVRLRSRKTAGVIAGGQQIYATDTSTYVSTTDWSRDGSAAKTSLHKFVTAPQARAPTGSGEFPGPY